MHWRRFRISEIPLDNEAAFAMWLKNRWTEKDYLLEHFFRHGTYPEGDPVKAMHNEAAMQKLAKSESSGDNKRVIKPVTKGAKFITTEVKAGGMEEFLAIFSPITAAATALSTGDLPSEINFDALLGKVAQQQQLNLLATGSAPKGPKSHEEMRKALTQASKALGGGQQIQGSTIEQITRNAVMQQKEMMDAMSKKDLPRKDLPKTNNPTAGRRLDPAVQNMIEKAHEETRQRLLRASKPSAQTAKAPNVRKSIPMTPMETIVTRPLSTLALQRASQHVQRAAAARKAQPGKAQPTNNQSAKNLASPARPPKSLPSQAAKSTAGAPPKLSDAKKDGVQQAGKKPGAPSRKASGLAVSVKK